MRSGLLALRGMGAAGAAVVLMAAPAFGAGAIPADIAARVVVAPVVAAPGGETGVEQVDAGAGGAARLAADHRGERRSGPGTPQAVIGLVLAGVSAVAVAFSSGRRRRATGKDPD